MIPPHPNPLTLTADGYASACSALNLRGGVAGALDRYRKFFREGPASQGTVPLDLPAISQTHESDSAEGRVLKFTLPVAAAQNRPDQPLETESVVIPMIGKKRTLTHTLCVSSQVGCAMGCTFCQTAQMGLLRNLTAIEIVQQWYVARHFAPTPLSPTGAGYDSIRNIVFMGMGEPMDNLASVIEAIAVLTDHNGAGVPMSKVTISTVGRVDGIHQLAEQVHKPGWHRLNLAVSLNAPNDQIRAQIMPINRKYAMRELRAALAAWPIYGAAKICFEYVLIPTVNDQQAHAHELADFILGRGEYAGLPALHGLVNLIPYNPRDNSPWQAPLEDDVDQFLNWLLEAGTYAKRRRTKGRDTMAACGQLGNPAMRRKPVAVKLGGLGQTGS